MGTFFGGDGGIFTTHSPTGTLQYDTTKLALPY